MAPAFRSALTGMLGILPPNIQIATRYMGGVENLNAVPPSARAHRIAEQAEWVATGDRTLNGRSPFGPLAGHRIGGAGRLGEGNGRKQGGTSTLRAARVCRMPGRRSENQRHSDAGFVNVHAAGLAMTDLADAAKQRKDRPSCGESKI